MTVLQQPPLKGLNYEHTNSAISLPLRNNNSIAWSEIVTELQVLEEKMKNADKVADADSIIFPSLG